METITMQAINMDIITREKVITLEITNGIRDMSKSWLSPN